MSLLCDNHDGCFRSWFYDMATIDGLLTHVQNIFSFKNVDENTNNFIKKYFCYFFPKLQVSSIVYIKFIKRRQNKFNYKTILFLNGRYFIFLINDNTSRHIFKIYVNNKINKWYTILYTNIPKRYK